MVAQAEYALMAYNDYQNAILVADTKLVFYHIHHFVIHVTNIDKLPFPRNNYYRNNVLKDIQKKIQIDIAAIRKLRNHLEHFDERLDAYVKSYIGQAFFDCNIVNGTKRFPEKDYLRAIDGNTYKFYGESFDLAEIHNHIELLIKSLSELWNSNIFDSKLIKLSNKKSVPIEPNEI